MTADTQTETRQEQPFRTPGILRLFDPVVHPVYLAEASRDRAASADTDQPVQPETEATSGKPSILRLFGR